MQRRRAAQPHPLRRWSSSPPSGSTCWSPSSSTAPPSSARPRSTTQVIDDGLGIIRKLWDAGLAHRDIKPANLLVRDGRMLLIDVAFVEARPSPWRQAVDLANMMLCLALRSSPEQVYQRALRPVLGPGDHRGVRRRPRAGPALPAAADAQGAGPRPARRVRAAAADPAPAGVRSSAGARGGSGCWPLTAVAGLRAGRPWSSTRPPRTARTKTLAEVDNLACTDLEPLWLQAQAVPSASLVPCVQPPARRLVARRGDRQRRPVGDRPAPRPGRRRGGGGPADRRLRHRAGGRGGLGTGRGPPLPAGRAPGAVVHRGAVRRLPRGLCDHPDQDDRRRTGPRSPARPPASSASPPATSSARPSSGARTAASTSTRSGGARWERPSGTRRSCTTGRSAS